MKKLLSTMLCATVLTFGAASAFAESVKQPGEPPVKAVPPVYKFEDKNKPAFDKGAHEQRMKEHQQKMDERLNLTAEQKKLAEKNRLEGQKKIKPVMEQIKAKKEAIRKIKGSDLTEEQKQQKIAPLKKDLKGLHQKANTIREQNMKNFEAILTPEQKTEFAKMKEEGRAKRKEQKAKHGKEFGGKKPHKDNAKFEPKK